MYKSDGQYCRAEKIRHPTWPDIETSILRLDQFQLPFIWLFNSADAAEDALPDFNVIGGNGLYAFDCRAEGREYRYHNPLGGDTEVTLWRRDQGWDCAEKYVCTRLDTVLQAVQYFCTHSTPDPTLSWEE
jgi:hypothetical protein